ncbi:MAG TPA: hypothetical protein VFN48_04785 [Solirubrobacteraceae bacterium]|nr:hypothetical protein [Solirubrobacteraceae bacterium]
MNSIAITLTPISYGWSVAFTDGRELARFVGPFARRRAERFLASLTAGL